MSNDCEVLHPQVITRGRFVVNIIFSSFHVHQNLQALVVCLTDVISAPVAVQPGRPLTLSPAGWPASLTCSTSATEQPYQGPCASCPVGLTIPGNMRRALVCVSFSVGRVFSIVVYSERIQRRLGTGSWVRR